MSLAKKLGRPATLADIEALPPDLKGEILDGELYVMTRPRARQVELGSLIGGDLVPPFRRGRGGPGGWWILAPPGIELPGSPGAPPISPAGAASGCRRFPSTSRSASCPIGSARCS